MEHQDKIMQYSFPKIITEWKFKDMKEVYPGINCRDCMSISPPTIYKNFKEVFKNLTNEILAVFMLNVRTDIIAFEIVSRGSLSSSVVHPREVFRSAIVNSCASIIIAHNHPSGNRHPSEEDKKITQLMVDAGNIIGITVVDHIIFTNDGYTSFVKEGLI